MKKILIAVSMAAIFTMSISSCSKCQICSKPNSNEVRICEKDYKSNTAYGFAVDAYEANGYACKGSI